MNELVAVVERSHDWWVARCPACGSGEHAGVAAVTLFGANVVGGLTSRGFACLRGCGWRGPAKWPSPELADGVLAILALRPMPWMRSWEPHESLHDLLLENAEHGIGLVPEGLTAGDLPGEGALLRIDGDEITAGRELLPAVGRYQLEG